MRIIRLGPATIDLLRRTVRVGTESTTLTTTEAALVGELARHSPQPVGKPELLKSVWGYHAAVRSRTVDTTVGRLRAKIERVPGSPEFLLTVHGRGLQLVGIEIDQPEEPSVPRGLFGADETVANVQTAVEQGGLVAVLGPPGVGKSTAVRAALPSAVWVDVAGLESREALRGAVSRALGSVQMLDVNGVVERTPRNPVVLDGAETLEAASIDWAEKLSRGIPVVLVSQSLPERPTDAVIRLAPLGPGDARALLDAQLGRLGLEVSEATRDGAIAQIDGLPLEIEVLAPTLGLLGVEALSLRSPDDPVTVAIERSLAALAPADQELVHQLSVFSEQFSLAAAVAVTGRAPAELVAPLARLQRHSLLHGAEGRFQLLRAVRRVAATPVEPQLDRARDAASIQLDRWLSSLVDRALIDGAATLRHHHRDLLQLLRRVADPDDADTASAIWMDLAFLMGPEEDFAVELGRLARRFPQRRSLGLRWLLTRTTTVGLTEEERAEVEGDTELEALWVLVRDALQAGDRERWIALNERARERLVDAPLPVQARMLPMVRQPDRDPQRYRKETETLRVEARSRGWRAIEANLARSELSLLVLGERYAEALSREAEWPRSDDVMGSESAFWLGVCEMMLGRPEAALSRFEQQAVRHPTDVGQGFAHTGVALLAMGDRHEALTRLGKAVRPGLPHPTRQLCLALLAEHGADGFPPADDPELLALITGPLPEQPPARVSHRLWWLLHKDRP